VYWNGTLALSLPNAAPGYTQETLTGLVATGTSTVLQFSGRDDPNLIWLDDVDVEATPTSSVPEPASIAFCALGLAGVWLRRRCSRAGL